MDKQELKSDENRQAKLNFLDLKKGVLVIVLVLVASLAFAGFARAQKEVTIIVDGKKIASKTFASTVQDLVSQQKIKLNDQDRVIPQPETDLKGGMQVIIRRAVPVSIMVDGQKLALDSSAETVKEVIQEQKIKLNELDQVEPGLDKKLAAGMEIKIARIEQKIVEKKVSVPFVTEKKPNPNLFRGLTKVERAGKNGLEKQVWQITYQDGQEIDNQIIKRETVTPPVARVIQVGTKQQVVSRGGETYRYSKAMYMTATAYTYTGSNTASGVPPYVGAVAVDPRVIPLGTRLYIDGYGYAKALDKGSAIKGSRIDLFLESEAQCRRWGVRKVKVYILK